jgi:hypothetical protein
MGCVKFCLGRASDWARGEVSAVGQAAVAFDADSPNPTNGRLTRDMWANLLLLGPACELDRWGNVMQGCFMDQRGGGFPRMAITN